MTYTLNAALDRIVAIQAAISITSPITKAVVRAYKDPPATVEDVPCFLNIVEPGEVTYGPGYQRQRLHVKMQFLCRDEKAADASAIARAFLEATRTAFNGDIRLAGTCTVAQLGATAGVTGLEYAKTQYIGFELPLVVSMHDAVTFA
jgi:hypothetical protein